MTFSYVPGVARRVSMLTVNCCGTKPSRSPSPVHCTWDADDEDDIRAPPLSWAITCTSYGQPRTSRLLHSTYSRWRPVHHHRACASTDKYCVESVCLSVHPSVRSHNSKTTRPNVTDFFEHVATGRGLISSDGVAIRFYFRSCGCRHVFDTVGPMGQNQARRYL